MQSIKIHLVFLHFGLQTLSNNNLVVVREPRTLPDIQSKKITLLAKVNL